jgi:hypothetical protein
MAAADYPWSCPSACGLSPGPFPVLPKAQSDTRFSYGNVFTESGKKFHNLGCLVFPVFWKEFPVIGRFVNYLKTLWKQFFSAAPPFVVFFGIFFAASACNLSRPFLLSTVSPADSFVCKDKNNYGTTMNVR